jgi:uncharacterized membrane protein
MSDLAQPSKKSSSLDPACNAIKENIDAIVRLEESFVQRRRLPERIADLIGNFAGSFVFVVLHVVFYGVWILINLGLIPPLARFDPFPFMLLNVLVSLEAIFLATFVLIKQNRMSKRADQRAHLDLQINLLAEREMTLMLQMLQRICTRLGVRMQDQEIEDLAAETSVEALAQQLQEKLPE